MMGRSHTIIAATSALLVTIDPASLIFAIPIAILGGWFPDIDHRGSKMGRILFFLSFFISKIFSHRTATHSILAVSILAAGCLFVENNYPMFTILAQAFTAGFISHILSDMFTKKGVQIFYPFGGFISFTGARTGGSFEKLLVVAISSSIIGVAVLIN